jgi:hypothetical protein
LCCCLQSSVVEGDDVLGLEERGGKGKRTASWANAEPVVVPELA